MATKQKQLLIMEIKPTYITLKQATQFEKKGMHNWDDFLQLVNIPEQWQVVEWLRVEKGIWIEVRHIKTFGINRFHLIIRKYKEEDYRTIHCDNGVGYEVWDSPQEAYSAAFDYILNNNLI